MGLGFMGPDKGTVSGSAVAGATAAALCKLRRAAGIPQARQQRHGLYMQDVRIPQGVALQQREKKKKTTASFRAGPDTSRLCSSLELVAEHGCSNGRHQSAAWSAVLMPVRALQMMGSWGTAVAMGQVIRASQQPE